MDYLNTTKQRKIIKGQVYRRYFVDSAGEEIGIPMGITLSKKADYTYVQIRLNKQKYPDFFRMYIAYDDKQSQELAYKKSIAIVAHLSKGKGSTIPNIRECATRKDLHPAFDIDRSKIPSGVAVHSCMAKNYPFLKIMVTYFDSDKKRFMPKSMYGGTANTWRSIYPQKLEEAIKLREDSLKLYNELTQVTK